jgi:hypothetical protein
MIDNNQIYAVIGASANEEKYGFKVLQDLLAGGFKAIPVNPKGGVILGQNVYPAIADITAVIGTAVLVVPPAVTEKILPDIKAAGIKNVWLQPGSESEAAIKYCQANGLNCVHHACIMVERKK